MYKRHSNLKSLNFVCEEDAISSHWKRFTTTVKTDTTCFELLLCNISIINSFIPFQVAFDLHAWFKARAGPLKKLGRAAD